MPKLDIGDTAPDFTLPTDAGTDLTLSQLRGQNLVLFFYPKDDTPGCTVENIEFTGLAKAFAAANTRLIGISPDSVQSHCEFRDKHALGATLVADPDHEAINAYGVWQEKKNYGKTYMGLVRTTFLIDVNGKIAKMWTVRGAKGHAEKVLATAQSLADQPL